MEWTTIQIISHPVHNVVAAVRMLAAKPKNRYQVHVGRLNTQGVFSPGVSLLSDASLGEAVKWVVDRAEEAMKELRAAG